MEKPGVNKKLESCKQIWRGKKQLFFLLYWYNGLSKKEFKLKLALKLIYLVTTYLKQSMNAVSGGIIIAVRKRFNLMHGNDWNWK